jgi:O-antigen/teichoic acid export membrane protein
LVSARFLAVSAFWSLLSHIFSRGSLMLSAIILARSLDTAAFAAYSYFQLTVSMLAAYAAMGFGVSASRFFSEVGHEKSDADPPPIGTLWMLSVILAVLAFLLIMLIPDSWITAGLLVPKWMLAVGVLALGLTVVPDGAIIGLERYKQATLISGFSGGVMLLVVWWASQRGLPIIAMGGIALAALLQAAGESVIIVRAVGWRKISAGFRLRQHDVRRVFSLAGPMFFVTLVSASGSWLLGRMILRSGGEHVFALYVIGLQWFSLGLLLPGMLSRVILPRLVRSKSSALAEASAKKIVMQGSLMATAAALAMTFFGLLFGPWLILIYGTSYQVDRWFIATFLGAAIFSAPANTLGNAIVANDGQKTWLIMTVIWLLALLAGGAIAAPLGALSGAIAQAIAAVVLIIMAIKVARVRNLI